MSRSLALALTLAIAICPLTGALADDAKDKPATVTAEPATPPKIRVILPASWEPATPQAASPQRNAAR
jgi:hypothetical protein